MEQQVIVVSETRHGRKHWKMPGILSNFRGNETFVLRADEFEVGTRIVIQVVASEETQSRLFGDDEAADDDAAKTVK
jgi:hypothetical protein